MTGKEDGFRLERCDDKQDARRLGQGKDGYEWTCYTWKDPKPRVRRKPWVVSVYHFGVYLLHVEVVHPALTLPAGKRAIKKWLKEH